MAVNDYKIEKRKYIRSGKYKGKVSKNNQANTARYRRKLKQTFFEMYGKSCECCGENSMEFLTLEHKKMMNGSLRHKTNRGNLEEYAGAIKQYQPNLFGVLCFNCNNSLGIYGYCPHKNSVENCWSHSYAALDGQGDLQMDLYIAICCDRHIDEVVRVFTTQEKAVSFCKEFAKDEELEEQELNDQMVRGGWVYYATYSPEGDSVRVEKGTLDPKE